MQKKRYPDITACVLTARRLSTGQTSWSPQGFYRCTNAYRGTTLDSDASTSMTCDSWLHLRWFHVCMFCWEWLRIFLLLFSLSEILVVSHFWVVLPILPVHTLSRSLVHTLLRRLLQRPDLGTFGQRRWVQHKLSSAVIPLPTAASKVATLDAAVGGGMTAHHPIHV